MLSFFVTKRTREEVVSYMKIFWYCFTLVLQIGHLSEPFASFSEHFSHEFAWKHGRRAKMPPFGS